VVEVIKRVTVKIESDKKYFRMISLSNRYHVEDCVVIHFFTISCLFAIFHFKE
jgi:hypothetical protein